MTKYRLAKSSGVPQTTVLDICSGKTQLKKCTAETVYKLAKALDVSMDILIAGSVDYRPSFEYYKSTVGHMVKDMGDLDFLISTLETDEIRRLYNKQWFLESLYLLAMVDYLSKENNFPLCSEYNDMRKMRMQSLVFPIGIHTRCIASGNDQAKVDSLKEAIPEFLRYNIVESEIRNVC